MIAVADTISKAGMSQCSLATLPQHRDRYIDLGRREDKVSPEATVVLLKEHIPKVEVITMKNVGDWHLVEDVEDVARELREFIE
jgi:pimeloyl-ACP methyl ester carboxylesterase